MSEPAAYSTRPSFYLRQHARSLLTSRRHRAQAAAWLNTLGLADADELLDDIANRSAPDGSRRNRSESTALLLGAHQGGDQLATAVLLGAKANMLCAIARFAHAASFEEKLHLVIETFLERVLDKVRVDHDYLDGQLYFVTLRTVTATSRRMGAITHAEVPSGAGPNHTLEGKAGLIAGDAGDVDPDMDSYMSASALLDWALQRGVINDFDHRALQLRHTGSTTVSVREAAARLGVSEDGLESRLRRARTRLQAAACAHRDEIERACVAARWARPSPAAAQSKVAA